MPPGQPQFDEAAEREAWARLQEQLPEELREQQARLFSPDGGAKLSWHLVVLLDMNPEPVYRAFDTFDLMVAAIRELKPRDWAAPFYGYPVRYAVPEGDKQGLRYIVNPIERTAVPLFEIPQEVKLSTSLLLQGFAPEEDEEEDDEPEEGTDLEDARARPAPGEEPIPVSEDLPEEEDEEDEEDEDGEERGEFPGLRPA